MKGVLSTVDLNDASLVAKAKASPGLVGRDLVREVIPEKPIEWHEPLSPWTRLRPNGAKGDSPIFVDTKIGTVPRIHRWLWPWITA